jgi:hypothetical protein
VNFLDWWFVHIVLKEIAEMRLESHCDGPAVLIVDGRTTHDDDCFLDLCMERNIIPIPILPHSSHQVQLLDLTIFSVIKRLIARLNKMEQGNVRSFYIAKIVSAFHSAVNPINVITWSGTRRLRRPSGQMVSRHAMSMLINAAVC